ncbi:glucose-1-phosphate adenylyltransferase-like isoform X1 [Branchiostoma floridae]|uniref:Glucose-1-phosphate adenylyltransferase-like isoform X1 n=2 Tax=Branchiostoma floridae TaxID=7739 RepID=A0A9J7HV36_BRAFL|nr:glucose-1-phosphate adenylyltransferase-like isoform X1 [Branchiostoma floridae]
MILPEMKVLFLAAGYGTRLERDVLADQSGKYDHLRGIPKPLVPVGGRPLISHWMDILMKFDTVEQFYLVTNRKYLTQFEVWAQAWPKLQIVSDGTTDNETRSGAVRCIQLAVEHFQITDDLLVIGGDTLLYEDFDLKNYLERFLELQKKTGDACLVTYYNCAEHETVKFGILEVDEHDVVTRFREKPRPEATPSRRACPCFYLYSNSSLPLLQEFLSERKDCPLKEIDAPGNFLQYLYTRRPVFVYKISGRFDVGGLQSYIVCDQYFMQKRGQ